MTRKGVHNSDDMYNYYRELYPDSQITRSQYKAVLREYNKEVIDELLTGETVPLKYYMGALKVIRIERDFNKLAVNFNETAKLKSQGINKVVYHTDDEYIRVKWFKHKARVSHSAYYRFTPARGHTGLKSIVSQYFIEHPEMKHKFKLELK